VASDKEKFVVQLFKKNKKRKMEFVQRELGVCA